ncbi:hypothetical protein RJ639_016407 [Escallonia herrerae]|uniref:Reverse transcriptase Ty1/copia-type domain-containing protein n=1 Tax=Escallonia herrerae TaxID=1293975 RepID=A0AA88VEK9_9ASTE|nr:hypothetical protein RJ639_016407 [Escallonia herrerae]
MAKEFEMTDIGLMSYYLEIEVKQRDEGTFISQEAYAKEILKMFNMKNCNPIMENCNPINFPIEMKKKLSRHIKGVFTWTSKKQSIGTLSRSEAEYVAAMLTFFPCDMAKKFA